MTRLLWLFPPDKGVDIALTGTKHIEQPRRWTKVPPLMKEPHQRHDNGWYKDYYAPDVAGYIAHSGSPCDAIITRFDLPWHIERQTCLYALVSF